jgi:aspartate aminotransferase
MATRSNGSPDMCINLNVRGLKQSAALAINELSAKLAHEGKTIYKLGLGESPFPVSQPVLDEFKINALNTWRCIAPMYSIASTGYVAG